MLYKLTQSELRNICREKLESVEHWLRRLIDDTLTPKYGDYFSYKDDNGNRLIAHRIVKPVEERVTNEPQRYPRKVDAILLDDAISIICNPNHYHHFSDALSQAFPNGCDEAKTFFERLIEPRNRLAHANSISMRQGEQILCYSNDVVDSLKDYYSRQGMSQTYDVPLILKITDSFGNVFHRNQMQAHPMGGKSKNLTGNAEYHLRPGDTLTVEIEVDPTYSAESYTIKWISTKGLNGTIDNTSNISIPIALNHVGEAFDLQCRIESDKGWHKLSSGADDLLLLKYKVLPPMEID